MFEDFDTELSELEAKVGSVVRVVEVVDKLKLSVDNFFSETGLPLGLKEYSMFNISEQLIYIGDNSKVITVLEWYNCGESCRFFRWNTLSVDYKNPSVILDVISRFDFVLISYVGADVDDIVGKQYVDIGMFDLGKHVEWEVRSDIA